MNFRGALHRGVKIIPGRCILRMISCVRIWTHLLFSKKKKYLAVLILFMGIICWTISILGYLNSSYFIQIAKNLLRSWFIDGAHMLNHIITPRNQQNSTFFHYISLWIRFFLHRFLVIIDWPQRPYNQDYHYFCINPWYRLLLAIIHLGILFYISPVHGSLHHCIIVLFLSTLHRDYCYPYKLSWWCSLILLKYPGLDRDIHKAY